MNGVLSNTTFVMNEYRFILVQDFLFWNIHTILVCSIVIIPTKGWSVKIGTLCSTEKIKAFQTKFLEGIDSKKEHSSMLYLMPLSAKAGNLFFYETKINIWDESVAFSYYCIHLFCYIFLHRIYSIRGRISRFCWLSNRICWISNP